MARTKPKSTRNFLLRIILRVCLTFAAILILATGITLLQVWWLASHNPETTSWMRMRQRQAKEAKKTLVVKHSWVSLTSLPKSVSQAVIAAEDDQFFQHDGFDWDAIRKARAQNEKSGRIKRGGSTITQQLAKNLYLSPERSYIRKAREGVITAVMEWLLPKPRILELYLNSIEFGPGVFGVEEGARYHFGVSAKRLTLEQSCKLAAIIPAPLRYKVTGPYVTRRAQRIQRMIG